MGFHIHPHAMDKATMVPLNIVNESIGLSLSNEGTNWDMELFFTHKENLFSRTAVHIRLFPVIRFIARIPPICGG